MKALDVVERAVLYIIAAVAVVLALDGLLHQLEANADHQLVSAVRTVAQGLTPEALTDMFVDQSPVQTALLALLAWGLLAALVVGVFRLVRNGVNAFTPVSPPPPAAPAPPPVRLTQTERDAERERMRLERERRQAVRDQREL